MHAFSRPNLGLIILAAMVGQPAQAQVGAVYLVTYVDVMPNAADAGAALLKRYRDASRNEDGNLRFEVVQEIARPQRFAILEVWGDKAKLDAHAAAMDTVQFRDRVKTIEDAPEDERINNGLYFGSENGKSRSGAIYVLTHVDVIPSGKDDCLAALKAMSIDTPKDSGNISYEVLQQANRPNHFTVAEVWADSNALDGHAMAAHTRTFRERLSPIAGALYDERFYKALD